MGCTIGLIFFLLQLTVIYPLAFLFLKVLWLSLTLTAKFAESSLSKFYSWKVVWRKYCRWNSKQCKNQLSHNFEKLFFQLLIIWIKIKTINFDPFSATSNPNIESINYSIEKRIAVKEIDYCRFSLACFVNRPILARFSWLWNVCLANKIVPF